MTLSSLAIKALIGFSLGLNANTSPNQTLGDSIKKKKTNCEIKTGAVKNQQTAKKQVANGSAKNQKALDSCGKCGKG